jgi:hypothetical protein
MKKEPYTTDEIYNLLRRSVMIYVRELETPGLQPQAHHTLKLMYECFGDAARVDTEVRRQLDARS